MRCKNCGWENPDSNTKCEKCNTPFFDGENTAAEQVQTHAPAAVSGHESGHGFLNETVHEGAFFPPETPLANTAEAAPNPVPESACPSCGYPMRPGVQVCPNCNYGLNISQSAASSPLTAAGKQKSDISGTVNPWIDVQEDVDVTGCRLIPVKHGSETQAPQERVFTNAVNELNRSCLDAENMTITSNVQARLTFENGQWFIEDASSQKTTYIHVSEKTQLKDGDIILMGNRQFVVKI